MPRLQVQQLTLTVYIVLATSALIGEALLNCAPERAKYAHIFEQLAETTASSEHSWTPTTSMSPPGSTRLSSAPSAHPNASDGGASTKSPALRRKGPRPFIEPILHECMNEHRYDITQLPLRLGAAPHPIEMTYYFFLNNLISLDETGSLSLKAFLKVRLQNFNADLRIQ